MKISILSDFKASIKEAELAAFAANVLTHMKGNPLFADIQTPLIDTELQQAYDRFLLAYYDALNRHNIKIAEKRVFKTDLIGVLEKTAVHVHIIAKGNEAIIHSSGFHPKRPPVRNQKNKPLQPVSKLQAQGNIAGEVKLSYKTTASARTYIVEMSVEENVWSMVTNSSSGKAIVRDVPLQKEVSFRVFAIGSGQRRSAPSEVVKVYLL